MGTGGRVSFRVTLGNMTGRGQDARRMSPGRYRAGKVQRLLALILAGFLSPPVPWC